MDTVAPFVILIAIAVLFWVVMIRPAQRRQRAVARLQESIAVNDEVMLTSGIFGVVRALDEEALQLQVADGVTLRVVRGAIARVVTPESPDVETGPEAPAAEGAEEIEEMEETQSDGPQ